jgi:V/A-type H+/Na+-transporting ATPase subunit A
VDRVCSPARQAAMMKLLDRFMTLAEAAQAHGATPETLAALPVLRPLQRMGEDIGDTQLPLFDQLAARLEREFAPLLPAAATVEALDAPER